MAEEKRLKQSSRRGLSLKSRELDGSHQFTAFLKNEVLGASCKTLDLLSAQKPFDEQILSREGLIEDFQVYCQKLSDSWPD